MPANAIAGLLGCGLLSLAVVATLIRLRRLPARARYAVMLAAALALFVPIGDSRSPRTCAASPETERGNARPGGARERQVRAHHRGRESSDGLAAAARRLPVPLRTTH